MPATRHLLPQLLLLPLTALASGCSLIPSVPTTPLEVPSHDADDPRTKTGGFVRQVRLAEVEQDGTKYILMA